MQELQETQVGSLGQKDPLEKSMATHSSILAWRIPGTEEPGSLQSKGSDKQSDTTEQLLLTLFVIKDFASSRKKCNYTHLHAHIYI